MNGKETIAIFDIGKTNKKLLLFDNQYNIVYEENERMPETVDEDGFPCEDILLLTKWMKERFEALLTDRRFIVKAVNFSGYGASLVYLDEQGEIIPPLYNYLKDYPAAVQGKFYQNYGGQSLLCRQTASPALGSLNSGLQLYRIKYKQPEKFKKIRYALHLPQYLSYVLSGSCHSELTSIGCHTHLWDFNKKDYHEWVVSEELDSKFPGILNSASLAGYYGDIAIGIGLHDSSAALIPYLNSFNEPFLLLSTGTWSISLNPFNKEPLTDNELANDCLCFLSLNGEQVKASRLFAGYMHEQQVKRLSEHFHTSMEYYASLKYEREDSIDLGLSTSFEETNLSVFANFREAYIHFIKSIVSHQVKSTNQVKGNVKKIFVDGGFSKNEIFMHLVANAFPKVDIYAASVSQASATGAALVMHEHWNKYPKPDCLVEMKLVAG